MAGKSKDIMEIKQLILLHSQKKSNRKIGKILGMSRNTVNSYVSLIKELDEPVEELLTKTDEELSSLLGRMQVKDAKRFKELTDYFPEVLTGSKQVGFTYYKMWEEYRIRHPTGFGYTQFLAHYHKWNSKTEATLKINHKAGEYLLVDYAGDKLSWIDQQTGEVHDVEMFVGCLPASGFTFAECSPSQQKEDFISSMINCLNYIGGSPQCIVVDNLKSAVSKSSKYEAVTNRTFRDMADHYGSILNPARPYRPKDKAMVERMVDLLYEAIYFPLRHETFFSLHELNERVRELLDKFNDKKLSQLECSRRALFLSIEHDSSSSLDQDHGLTQEFVDSFYREGSEIHSRINTRADDPYTRIVRNLSALKLRAMSPVPFQKGIAVNLVHYDSIVSARKEYSSAATWSVEFFGGINQATFDFTSQDDISTDLKGDTEFGVPGYSFGFLTTMSRAKKVQFSTGFEFHRVQTKFRYEIQRDSQVLKPQTLHTVVLDSLGNTVSRQFGDRTVDATITRSVRHYNRYELLSVPITMGYKKEGKKWSYGLNGGLAISLWVFQSGKTLHPNSSIVNFGPSDASTLYDRFGMGIRVNSFLSYELTDHILVTVRPQWTYSSAQVFEGTHLKVGVQRVDLNFGMGWRF